MLKGISGFGHAVKSIDEVAPIYSSLWGLTVSKRFATPQESVNEAVFIVPPNFAELIEPIGQSGPVARFLQRRGEGLYHITLVVDDVEKEVRSLRQKGAEVMDAPALEPVFHRRAWLHPRSTMGVLLELVDVDPMAQWGPQNAARQGVIARISHIHHIVRDLDKAVALYERLWGLRPNQRHDYPEEGFRNAIMPIGSNYIGILSPTNAKNPLTGFLDKYGDGLRSVCFLVKDVDEAAAGLKARGADPFVQPASHHTPFKAAWISPRHTRGLVVELFPEKEATPYMAGR